MSKFESSRGLKLLEKHQNFGTYVFHLTAIIRKCIVPLINFAYLIDYDYFSVIGGGITSAVSASLLSKQLCSKNVKLSVWDKARGAGGRMSTSRSPGNPQCITDLGAQFISAKPEYKESHE